MKLCLSCKGVFENGTWKCPHCGIQPECKSGNITFAPNLDNAGFDSAFFHRLNELEPKHFWFEARNRLIFWAIEEFFPLANNLLEIGCGTGFVLKGVRDHFPALEISGSEIFHEGLNFARERLPGVPLFQMDAAAIPFLQEFDVIGAFDVLEHIRDDARVLREISKAMKPDGGIIVTVPQHTWMWSVTDSFAHHQRRYTRSELIAKMKAAGFMPVFATSFVSTLLPLAFLSRFFRTKNPEQFDPTAEFSINPLLNKALERLLAMEQSVIKSRISFPLGLSLLVVGKKTGQD